MTKQAIICVDDDPTVLKSIKAELEEAFGDDYLIEIAEGGEDALKFFEAFLAETYEIPVIITDYILPDITGDELLRQIHQISPRTLKIMLADQAKIEAVADVVEYANLYRYIVKPWQAEDLKLTVIQALNSYCQEKELTETNLELLKMNQELEQLTQEQATLIEELHNNERRLKQFTEELFQVNQAFSRFVPRQFIQLMDKDSIVDVQLGNQVERKMSVLFADIRDFTALSEKMTPEETFEFINAFFRRMEPAILKHNGFIDKYIGDAIMALFGDAADKALSAGVMMLKRLTDYNRSRQLRGQTLIQMGIGINTGSLMLGTVGSQNRMDGTVVSDTVNSAARIEELTKQYGVSLLISHHTLAELEDPGRYSIRLIDQVRVRGKSLAVSVFEVFDADPPDIRLSKLATKTQFERAIVFFSQNNFRDAIQLFQDCLGRNPEDKAANIYLEQCQKQIRLQFRTWRLQRQVSVGSQLLDASEDREDIGVWTSASVTEAISF